MATSWQKELVKRLYQTFTSRMQSFSRAVNRGEIFSAETIQKAIKLKSAIRKLTVYSVRYGIEKQAALKVKTGVYDEIIRKMGQQDGTSPAVLPRKKAERPVQAPRKPPRKKETMFVLLPCPECGSAPRSVGNKQLTCCNPECMLSDTKFSVDVWNEEIRAPWLSPNSFRPKGKIDPAGATLQVETLVGPGVAVIRPKKQDPELDIEWALRVKAINMDDDD